MVLASYKSLHVLILALLLLSGCSAFTRPEEKPIIEDTLSRDNAGDLMATLAVDATRRVIVANLEKNTSCAEPPPDVAESIARSFALAITASVERGDLDASLAPSIASQYQSAIKQLSPISQGVRYARDSLFSLCQARSNYFLKNEDFYWLFVDVLERSAVLIAQEIPYLQQGFDDVQAQITTDAALEQLERLRDKSPSAGIDAEATDAVEEGASEEENGDEGELE